MNKSDSREIIFGALFAILTISVVLLPQLIIKRGKVNLTTLHIKSDEMDFGEGTESVVISEDRVMEPGEYEFRSLEIKAATLSVSSESPVAGIVIRANEKIVIDENAAIKLDGMGYFSSENDEAVYEYAGGGGSSGGAGGSGSCIGSVVPKPSLTADLSIEYGSAGGIGLKTVGIAGRGGGYVQLVAPEIIIKGTISADGLPGVEAGGGGGGGKIVILANNLAIDGRISVNGGKGGSGQIQGAGGGSGGVVILNHNHADNVDISLNGGMGGQALDLYTGCSGKNGSSGQLVVATII